MRGQPTRRRALRSGIGLAVGTVLTGCLGGDSGDDGSDEQPASDGTDEPTDDGADDGATEDGSGETETQSATPSGVVCTELDNEYTAFDAGATNVVAEFEYPALFGELDVDASVQAIASAERPIKGEPDKDLTFKYTQLVNGREYSGSTGTGGDDRAIDTTIDFGGEEVVVSNNPNAPAYAIDLNMSLPYEVDGETLYFTTTIRIAKPNTAELSEECNEAMLAATRHLIDSLQPNPESTIAAEQS